MRFLFERGSVEMALLFPLFWLHNGRQALTAPTRGGAHAPLQWEHRILTTGLWGSSSDSDDEPTNKGWQASGATLCAASRPRALRSHLAA